MGGAGVPEAILERRAWGQAALVPTTGEYPPLNKLLSLGDSWKSDDIDESIAGD